MQKLFILLILVSFTLGCDGQKNNSKDTQGTEVVTNYYFIRHAEKDLSDPSNRNPDLTVQGEARAQRWKDYFSARDIDAVYSTDYLRTMRTAMPTAEAFDVEIIKYDPSDLYNEDFQEKTRGKNVVVVGHSNTTPNFANAASGTSDFKEIDESEYYHLYQVTLTAQGDMVKSKNVSLQID